MAARRANPSTEGTWVDETGVTWTRRGKRGRILDDRRVRSLLRHERVPLVVWQAFEITRYDDPAAKEGAGRAVGAWTRSSRDVLASEWRAEDGGRLLMLEVFC